MDNYLNQNVDTLFTNMETFAQKEGLIGKAVTQGDKTFLPVLSVSLGYGGGDTKGTKPQNTAGMFAGANSANTTGTSSSQVGAVGLGARLSTDAVIIIDKGNVTLVPVSGTGSVSSQVIEKIPQIMGNMNQNKQGQ